MTPIQASVSSNQPDLKVLQHLARAQLAALAATALIAAGVLGGWLIPGIAALMPDGWSLMKATTALCVCLATANLLLTRPGLAPRSRVFGYACAGLPGLLAGASLIEHQSGMDLGMTSLLALPWSPARPGLMAPQTASFLVLFSALRLLPDGRKDRLSALGDLLSVALMTLALVMVAGYCFGATGLVGPSAAVLTSPQTLICLCLLAFVCVGRRAELGLFSVLVGVGIGSRLARGTLPLTIVLPFLFTFGSVYSTTIGVLPAPYAAALTAAFSSLTFFAVVLGVARRTNVLERDLRDMSLTDELTKVYNRRGFQLLGDQAMREAQRNRQPLTVLFFDLDGLKTVNDAYGHAMGSQFVVDVADMLKATFRGADIVARMGGDEFAVVFHNSASDALIAARRLEASTVAANERLGRPYKISYSVGAATAEPDDQAGIADLVTRADAAMYRHKRAKYAIPA